jgi:phosphohistidine phosphatase
MPIYLIRHGEAQPGNDDAARPLSDRGRIQVGRVAALAARLGVRPREIVHSGLVRARQTAELLAAQLAPGEGVRAMRGLAPGDDPAVAAAECEARREDLMLVGHLPHLGRLAGLLVLGSPGRELIRFGPGTLAALARGDGGFLVELVIRPDTEATT